MHRFWKLTLGLFSVCLFFAVLGVAGLLVALWYYSQDLPDYRQLADYEPPIVTRVYAANGQLVGEFADERRVFVPIESVPPRVVQAFIASEDKTFFEHPGVDVYGIARAALTNLERLQDDRRPVGASTITQQVAKNFLLTNEVSIERKIKELILAFRIERALTKNQILELYLNQIFLGYRSYGIAAAAQSYFGKSLDELTIAEAAYLAGLPKAPSNYHPLRHREAAIERRNYVIQRMLEDGYVTPKEAQEASAVPLGVQGRDPSFGIRADYFVEEVRRELHDRYGEDALLRGGLAVRTTLDPEYQNLAYRVLHKGLVEYDRRHGWRGPIANFEPGTDWAKKIAGTQPPAGLGTWKLAIVLDVEADAAKIGLVDGSTGTIPLSELKWARPWRQGQLLGPAVKKPEDVLKMGDVVAVEPVSSDSEDKPYPPRTYGLRQIPDVQGAIVAMDPHTGRVLAMVGGFSFEQSWFNRATQAARQPGSSFKPFVYLAALENGYTPSTIVLDAPVVVNMGDLGKWKPENYTKKFYGPIPLRLGLERSRNLMTIRLAQDIGVDQVSEFGTRFGIYDNLPPMLVSALGAFETTVVRMTTAYAMLVNGGKRITASLIDRVQDRYGRTVYRHDARPCDACQNVAWRGQQEIPRLPDTREQLADERSVYQLVHMMEGVIQYGTGVRVRDVGKPLAGKTGTTNDSLDAWFLGFTPDLVVGVWVGFDQPRTLGEQETGSSAAAPLFRDFMMEALKDKPGVPFRVPEGLELVRVDHESGLPAGGGDSGVILEAFKPGTQPTWSPAAMMDSPTQQQSGAAQSSAPVVRGTGGLY